VKFQQRQPLPGTREELWPLFADVEQTALCIPGVESVKASGPDTWAGGMKVRVGPVGVNMDGTVTLRERDDKGYRLVIALDARDQRMGAAIQGVLTVSLGETQNGRTPLVVDADMNLLGKLAGLGQSIIRIKADDTLKKFAQNLGKRAGGGS